ncbi:hypothetical protein BGZ76_009480 [Entomortierella beljakovae]|nr:hypothetical protein BGZ76_009480 [Entomortierella beljakovae]
MYSRSLLTLTAFLLCILSTILASPPARPATDIFSVTSPVHNSVYKVGQLIKVKASFVNGTSGYLYKANPPVKIIIQKNIRYPQLNEVVGTVSARTLYRNGFKFKVQKKFLIKEQANIPFRVRASFQAKERDYYRGDYSDDESNPRGRDKFRRERSPEKDDFGRDKRRRKTSASPDDRERRPRRNRSSSKEVDGEPGDRYIPNYERDGYNPAPRHGRSEHFGGRYDSPGGYGEFRGQRRRDDGYGDMDGADHLPYGDMPPGWGNADRIDDPMKLDHLISFKQYCEHLRNIDRASHRYKRYTDEELQARYGTYKEEFTAKQYAAFFEAHKQEAWFQEKYHPDLSKTRLEEAQTLRKARHAKFIEDLAAGKYDNTTCDPKKANATAEAKTEKLETEAESAESIDKDGDIAITGEESTDSWLYLRNVLPNVSRSSIIERCEKVDGFLMLSLSEPHPLKDLQRIGWIKFKPGVDLQEALNTVNDPATEDFQVVTAAHRPTRARYTHEIANTDARIHADYELSVEIAKTCDGNLTDAVDAESESIVYDGVSLLQQRLKDVILETSDAMEEEGEEEDAQTAIKRSNEIRSLDLFIEYLRQVHLFCYYCGGDSDNAEEFTRKCSKHYRNPESKVPTNSKGAIWVKNLEQKLNLKLKPPTDEEILKLGGRSLEKGIVKFLQSKTQQDEPTKWRCKVCTKPFRGEEFVHKHIRTKHPEEIKSIENNIILFNNYILDPNHINPSAQQQQQLPPAGFGFGMPGPMFGGQPMPMNFMPGHPMGMPFMNPGVSPMPGFSPGFMPPSFPAAGAMTGASMDSIPRIGFDLPKRRNSKDEDKSKFNRPDLVPARPPSLMLDPRSRMADPRKVKSYVDLDAPAEGDIDAKYNLW